MMPKVQAVRRQGTHVRIAGANLAGGLLPPATIYVRERGKLHSTIPQEAWRVFKTSANVKGNQDGEVSEVEFQLDHLGSRSERTLEIVRHGYKGVVTLGVQRSEQVPAAFKSAGEGEAGKEAGSSDEREGLAQEVTRKASLAEDRSVEEKLWSEQQKAKTKSPIDDGDMGKGSKEALEQTEVAEEKGDIKSPAGAPINVPAADRQGKPVAEMMELLAVLAPTAISQSSHSTHGDAEHGRPALLQTPQSSREGWLIDHSDLEFATDATGWPIYLGRGALGTVYRGILAKSREVAIKALMFEVQESLEAALQEVDILIKLEHPNIVQFIGATPMDKCLLLVMEPMAGNLYHALNNDKCTWHKGGKDVALEIASALAFMHGNGVMHLDVKSFNVLLTSGNHAKLGGLGMCNMAGRESFIRSSESRGAQAWASPEMIAGEAVTLASDVYSFGVLLWEICTGEVPIRPLRAVNHEAGPQNEAPPEVVFLIDRCLAANPGDRPKMQEVYEVLKGF